MRKLSEENPDGLSSNQFANTREIEIPSVMNNTTKRISTFSTPRILNKDDKIVYIDGSFDILH